MAKLLSILRDIYIRSLLPIVNKKLHEYNEKYCLGCREPEIAMNQQAHNICMTMSWEDQLFDILPGILKEIKTSEISASLLNEFENYQTKDSLYEMLTCDRFCLTTFFYICEKDMHTDMLWQTRIAEAVYKHGATDSLPTQVRQFGKQYYKGLIRLPSG